MIYNSRYYTTFINTTLQIYHHWRKNIYSLSIVTSPEKAFYPVESFSRKENIFIFFFFKLISYGLNCGCTQPFCPLSRKWIQNSYQNFATDNSIKLLKMEGGFWKKQAPWITAILFICSQTYIPWHVYWFNMCKLMLNPLFVVTLFSSDCLGHLRGFPLDSGDTFIFEALGSETESVLRNFQKETLKMKQDIGSPWACKFQGFALFGSLEALFMTKEFSKQSSQNVMKIILFETRIMERWKGIPLTTPKKWPIHFQERYSLIVQDEEPKGPLPFHGYKELICRA